MTRDPLLPVRLVDGGWTTEGAGSTATPPDDAPPSTGARNFPCDPYPPPPWAKVASIAADLDSARAHALSTRDDDDPAWLDTLRAVTLSGEPAAVQALVEALSSLPAGGDVWEGT